MTEQTWNKDQIMAFLREHRAKLRALGVRKLGLFGSFGRDEAHSASDMDFLLELDQKTFTRWMDVWNFLEDSFGCEVDLVPIEDLREELRPYVLPEVVYVEDL